jgi:5,6,7,8-tetrahydromethanopterin hydro-lyase
MAMAKINQLCVGESLVGDGNEVAHIDLIMGPRGSAAETAFANCLTNNKDGFTSLLAVRRICFVSPRPSFSTK